jgi:hypothetical protein
VLFSAVVPEQLTPKLLSAVPTLRAYSSCALLALASDVRVRLLGDEGLGPHSVSGCAGGWRLQNYVLARQMSPKRQEEKRWRWVYPVRYPVR